jgi:hypothetical protein
VAIKVGGPLGSQRWLHLKLAQAHSDLCSLLHTGHCAGGVPVTPGAHKGAGRSAAR